MKQSIQYSTFVIVNFNQKTIIMTLSRVSNFFNATFAVVVIAFAVLSFACKTSVRTDSLPSCAATEPLDSLMSTIFTSKNEPGAILIVIKDDSLVYRRTIGLADLKTRKPIDMNTRFNVSSISKIFASAALLRLDELGLVNLNDPLSKYFPEFHDDFFSRITLLNILTHSSGLPDLRPHHPNEWTKYTKNNVSVFGNPEDYRLFGTETEHMKCFAHLRELEFEPGTHYQNNDPAYVLVAPLIEKITGISYDKWLSDNIFHPANVEGICYYNPGVQMPSVAHGYRLANGEPKTNVFRSKDGKWEEYDYGEAPFFISKADKGANMTPAEFVNWKKAYYNNKVITEESFQKIFFPYIHTDMPNVSYGLGCAVRYEEGFPVCEYHMSDNGGYIAMECSWPEKRLHYALFSNRNDWNYKETASKIRAILRSNNFLD